MKKLAFLILFGLAALGLQDMVQSTLLPAPDPTVTAWVKLRELFH
jgi:hypothetical protein